MLSKQSFESDLRDAIRSRDDVRKRTLRMLLTSIKLAEVERRGAIDEGGLLQVLQKEVKTRRESIEEADAAGRADIIHSNQEELELLLHYLPDALTPAEVQAIVEEVIAATEAVGLGDLGAVMKLVMPRVQGRVDGKIVSDIAKNLLQGS